MTSTMTYAGGKGRLWQEIVSLMPPHEIYIETHLGGGAVLRHKRPARASIGIDIDERVIAAASGWNVPGLRLHHGDAVTYLKTREFGRNELIYVDPPYLASTKGHRRYYRHEYSDDDHRVLLESVIALPCPVMISGYTSELYENALREWDRRELTNITHAGPKSEVVWANFAFSCDLHDYSRVGGTFRERDRIKRKASRWVRKFELMPEVEQRAVLSSLMSSPSVQSDFVKRMLRENNQEQTND